jgi:hypothetical protein
MGWYYVYYAYLRCFGTSITWKLRFLENRSMKKKKVQIFLMRLPVKELLHFLVQITVILGSESIVCMLQSSRTFLFHTQYPWD